MGSKSDAYEIDVLKAGTGQATTILTTTPITPYVALYTVTPSDSASGTEVTGGSYARVSSAGKWATPAAGSVANNAAITFPTATGSWSSGSAVVAFGILDASTSGNLLYWGALTDTSKTYTTNDIASFPSGALTITED